MKHFLSLRFKRNCWFPKLNHHIRRQSKGFTHSLETVLKTSWTNGLGGTYHVVSRKEFLQKLSLFMLNSFDDELIIAGDVEDGPARPWISQFDQGLVTHRVLAKTEEQTKELRFI